MSVREVAIQAYREAVPALGASLVGGLVAGAVLGGMRAELQQVPGLLVLVPALLATRGNVYGSLGARIATALHQGLVVPRISEADRRLGAAVAAALGNGILASLFAATAAFLVLTLLGWTVAPLPTLLGIALVAGVLSGTVLTVVVVTVVFAGYRRGYNPDTLVGPVVTTTGDVFGILFLLIAVRTVLAVSGGGLA
ncbi:mgtE-like transporter [Halogranum gelatinilyticum]|uniref:MgtE-like transporter n=1 Tax=Halogranum gelatinilyticum TaxID=660521 RepID=A0A1G9P651_9EURY|nr:magnesium transporter [Halogranum gelatinilyticum]SDL94288.1 mgtE-like transporter [Halogranum gelatinilyticum]